jgi:hypothetical protein
MARPAENIVAFYNKRGTKGSRSSSARRLSATVTGRRIDAKRLIVMFDQKPRERCVWMTPKPAFPALGTPMSPAWVGGSPHVKDLALLKSLRSCNFTLVKTAGGCRETSHFG